MLRYASHKQSLAPASQVDEKEYESAQAYARAKNDFGLVADHGIGLVTALIELALQPYLWNGPALRLAVACGFGPEDELVRMMALMVVCLPWESAISLPLSAYRTFVLEERFGFNKYTLRSWIADKVTSGLVDFGLAMLTMPPLVVLLRNLGESAWLYAWAFVTGFCIVFNVVHPIWIAPLFNTFRPLPEGPVRSGIEALVRSSGLRCERIFEVDGSRQSSHSNAYVAGFFGTKRIVIYDTLVTHLKDEVPPICSVVAHEIGHAVLHHNWYLLALATFQLFATFFTFGLCRTEPHLVTDFGFDTPCTYLYLHCFFLLYNSAVSPILEPLLNGFTRQLEFAADAYSVTLGYDIRYALKTIDAKNLGNANPDPLVSFCHHSHPTLVQRVAAVADRIEREAKKVKQKRA